MPFASPQRSRSRSITYSGGSSPPLQNRNYPKSESTTTISSIARKPSIRYCCLADLFRTQKRFKKKKKVVAVVVGVVHRRRLSPTLVVRERRRRGTSSAGKSKSGRRTSSYTGSGTGIGTGIISTVGARPGSIKKRTSNTTSLRASGATSVYNPTAPLPPIPQEGEGTDSISNQAEVEEVEEDTQASCPPTARHPLIIFVRAYKKRRRNQAGAEKQDEEAATAAAAAADENGENRRSGRRSGGFHDADVISPVLRAVHSRQEIRDIVEHGFFHRGRRSGGDGEGVERGVVFGQGYSVWNGESGQQQQQQESAAPVIGKIERIMGNPLSNDFYSDRASGSGHSRTNSAAAAAAKAAKEQKRESKRHSNPVINTGNVPLRTSSARPTTALELDTNLSPVSPDEAELSTARDFSPYGDNGIFKALSPPPPALPAAIALRYPNVTALMRANIPKETSSKRSSYRSSYRTSNRFSYTQLHDGTNLSDHISSQYSRIKEQKTPSPIHIEKVNTPGPLQSPPAWAAFGGFSTSQNSKSSSSQPSRISIISSGTEKSAEVPSVKSQGHAHRTSWNGRSVLDLDPAPPPVPSKHSPPLPPLVPAASAESHPLRRKDKSIPIEFISSPNSPPPKTATAPRVRTSAFGPYWYKNYPQLPPIPPDPEYIASGPGQLFLPTMMTRSGSNSKMSVLSVPSTISSFNTITRSTGLSPTPARHTPRDTPEPYVDESRDNNRMSVGASTILTETSETSYMTAAELELEMRKIRERARRASEDRRKQHEQSWLAEEDTERPEVGHHFF